ncbi:MAG TPA: Bax inhibitor-1/YccA family protein [Candidatus Avacidaminococcus intestinavium]|uniref:Bax inhibitor-1/YccA family protein n=1 Tax=Candidatus Avacidaminococcus intestinavium TaxID=2840684 RepID=A0A9D1MNA6_9FIRM|nr:Bax inhibitor-1/YccA family protein [Candidatus Avacidaminococcus intestinavium]
MENQSYTEVAKRANIVQSFFAQVYGWMFFGLMATGIVAYYVASSDAILNLVFSNKITFYGFLLAPLALVVIISSKIESLSTTMASFLFFLYAAVNGVTLSAIFLAYTQESIASTFVITAGTFGATALFGYVTKRDLSKIGNILFMLLIGLIIASLVNLFLQNEAMMWVITYAGIVIFVGLTAYDMQKLKEIAHKINDNEETISKFAVMGALTLYLDFINLFLKLLRIFGKKR